jgi:hypothetical protein
LIPIQPYGDGGRTLLVPAFEYSTSMKFDGNEYAEHGPTIPVGSTQSLFASLILPSIESFSAISVQRISWESRCPVLGGL